MAVIESVLDTDPVKPMREMNSAWLASPQERRTTFLAEPDRDTKFSYAFRAILEHAGVQAVRLPPRSPNLNSHVERFMRSVKDECLHRVIFFGERSLRKAVREFLIHFHSERNHQGLDNRMVEAGNAVGCATGEIECRARLGGILRYYYRQAA